MRNTPFLHASIAPPISGVKRKADSLSSELQGREILVSPTKHNKRQQRRRNAQAGVQAAVAAYMQKNVGDVIDLTDETSKDKIEHPASLLARKYCGVDKEWRFAGEHGCQAIHCPTGPVIYQENIRCSGNQGIAEGGPQALDFQHPPWIPQLPQDHWMNMPAPVMPPSYQQQCGQDLQRSTAQPWYFDPPLHLAQHAEFRNNEDQSVHHHMQYAKALSNEALAPPTLPQPHFFSHETALASQMIQAKVKPLGQTAGLAQNDNVPSRIGPDHEKTTSPFPRQDTTPPFLHASIHAGANILPSLPINTRTLQPINSLLPPHTMPPSCGSTEFYETVPAPHAPKHVIEDAQWEPQLCKEQADLVNLICTGANVFYTGSAGCGKSTVLKAFVKRLRTAPENQPAKTVNIIAPTGRAALDIGGATFWTYAGWTPDSMKKPLKTLKQVAHGKAVWNRLKKTDVLVIDEISMMENHHFERLNAVMKEARNSERPFGGVQLIVTGDFCQLPPVKPFRCCITCGKELVANSSGTSYKCDEDGIFFDVDKWAFRSAAWKECKFHHVNLTTIHRQSDLIFISILQHLRIGRRLTATEIDTLLHHKSNTHHAVKLFSTLEEVRVVNDVEFKRLRSRKYNFKCLDDFWHNPNHTHLISKGQRNAFHPHTLDALRDHRFEKVVALKQGMLVVLQINLDLEAGLVNGSQGFITGWEAYKPANLPKAPQNNGLSRRDRQDAKQTSTGAPVLHGEHADYRERNISRFAEAAPDPRWPIVRFHNGITKTIYAHCQPSELGDEKEKPYSLLSRTQIPLLPAWAMSVHKSQGMTLDRVVVDLSRAFEEGQAYVALSRARSLEGLKVEGLGRVANAAGGNEQVREFLKEKFGID